MKKDREITLPVILVCIVLFITSCDDTGTRNPRSSQYFIAPRITGLELTDETHMHHGDWGSPSRDGIPAYPNPSTGSFTLHFDLPAAGTVSAWVVRALGPGDTEDEISNYSGSGLFIPPGATAANIIDSESLPAGSHFLEWDGTDNTGRRLPVGFYRFYIQAGDILAWADLLLLWDCTYVPYGIEVPMCR